MRPLAIAVTGGIGAGKSDALQAFARRGIPTLSADEVVHRLIAEDPEVRAALEERFGTTDRAGSARSSSPTPRSSPGSRACFTRASAGRRSGGSRRSTLRSRRPRSRCCTRAGEMRVRRGRRGHRAGRGARGSQPTRPRPGATRLIPDEEKVAPCRLRLRERRHPRGARRVRRAGAGAAARVTAARRAGSSLGVTVIAVLLGVFGTIHFTQPAWYERWWHPFDYQRDRPRSRAELPPRPGAPRSGDLHGEQVRRRRPLRPRCGRPDAAPPRDGEGDRRPHRRLEVPRLRPREPRDQRPLRGVVPAPPARQVRLRAARARRLQRRAGERRPLARAGAADPVRRDARVRRPRREPEERRTGTPTHRFDNRTTLDRQPE